MWRNSYQVATEQGRRDEAFSSITEMHPALARLTARMAAVGYAEVDVMNVRLATEEAVTNAIRHGHQHDSSRPVRLSYLVTPRHVLVRVQDQGPGFRPECLLDPLDPANMDQTCGRGVFLMKATMTWVRYNATGNAVTLCKKRSA